ncbi:hypothetical protein PG999_012217 [Apiospora kogelbergensis]|uniref:F-box domain-containing protein n=1 Tax=Apiospora kogelbergensis TaxID=1337665 RepID=A0AAW0QKT5_9PEZI
MDLTNRRPSDIPSLLGVPREIRNEIYSYFLSVDEVFDAVEKNNAFSGQVGINFNNVYRFRVNHQIWEEAWEYLFSSNLWIQVEQIDPQVAESDQFLAARGHGIGKWYSYLQLPSCRIPLEYQRRLVSKVALNFRLCDSEQSSDNIGSKASKQTWLFAYHPLAYGDLMWDLFCVNKYPVLSIQVNPLVMECHRRFEKLIKPLWPIRGFDKVEFIGVDDYSVLRMLAGTMERGFPAKHDENDDLELKGRYHSMGRIAERECRYSDAMCQYLLGLTKPWNLGRLVFHTWELKILYTDLNISFSRCAHKYLTQLKKRAGASGISASHVRYINWMGVKMAKEALVVLKDQTGPHRRCAHLYLAFHRVHFAEHHVMFSRSGAIDEELGRVYLRAARDAYYATQMDSSPLSRDIIRANLDEDDRAVYDKVWHRPGPQAFKMLK